MKTLIWVWVVVGLLPVLFIIGVSCYSVSAPNPDPDSDISREGSSSYIYTHHHVLQVGSLRLELYPSLWSSIAAAIGIVLLVIGLAGLLHGQMSRMNSP